MAKQWYVVHAYSNFEAKVKASLEEHIRLAGMEDKFGQILIPTEEVVEIREDADGYIDLDDLERRLVEDQGRSSSGEGSPDSGSGARPVRRMTACFRMNSIWPLTLRSSAEAQRFSSSHRAGSIRSRNFLRWAMPRFY